MYSAKRTREDLPVFAPRASHTSPAIPMWFQLTLPRGAAVQCLERITIRLEGYTCRWNLYTQLGQEWETPDATVVCWSTPAPQLQDYRMHLPRIGTNPNYFLICSLSKIELWYSISWKWLGASSEKALLKLLVQCLTEVDSVGYSFWLLSSCGWIIATQQAAFPFSRSYRR